MIIILMGVTASGKTTVGRLLASALGYHFYDADDFHPRANIDKMQRGIPLDDADREPWLRGLAAWIAEHEQAGTSCVLTCSALKRSYRDIIVGSRPNVRLVYLKGDRQLISARLACPGAAAKRDFMGE